MHLLARTSMECQFDCTLTPEEQQRLCDSLRALSAAASSVGLPENPTWKIRKTGDRRDDLLKYRITVQDYPVEFWGESVDHLVKQVEETAHLLQSSISN